jgi:DNA-binding HxlR family transcriptional regulator
MPTSLLMEYVEIPKLLMKYGPQSISQIKSSTRNLNPQYLEHNLNFLLENKIITQEKTGVDLIYSITERGIGLLDFFKVKPSSPFIKSE